ncbi:MAG: gliding motility-associated C-terminal domain-containing protein [Crocinitomicaceae bacterium]|nr:gliding motility-associated C-terminal domain-containing protein [Crocinitomicaceae bacterium]
MKETEVGVPDHLWVGIESRLPLVGGVPAATAVAKLGIVKWVAVLLAAVSTIGGGIYLLSNKENTVNISQNAESTASKHSEKASLLNQATNTLSSPVAITQSPGSAAVTNETENSPVVSNRFVSSEGEVQSAPEENDAIQNGNSSAVISYHENSHEGEKEFENTRESSFKSERNNPSAPVTEPPSTQALTASFKEIAVDRENLCWFFIPAADSDASFEWTISDGSVYSDLSPRHTFSAEGEYKVALSVTDRVGNTKFYEKSISVYRPGKLVIVNSFSPGSNGKNDVVDFLAQSRNIKGLNSLLVLDSQGNTMYKSETSAVWNGENPFGEIAPAGSYRYLISVTDINGQKMEKAGALQLFRE